MAEKPGPQGAAPTDTGPSSPAFEGEGLIHYEARAETGFLERLLLDRRVSIANAVIFFCAVISIALAVFHLFAAVYGTPEGRSFRSVHLTVMLSLAVLMNPLFRSDLRDPVLANLLWFSPITRKYSSWVTSKTPR